MDRDGFSRQSSLFGLHAVRFDDTAVRRHSVARFQNDNIANHNILAFDNRDLPVAENLAGCGCHFHERLHSSLSLALLNQTHDGIDNDNDQNNQNIRKITECWSSARFYHGNHRLDQCGG